MTHEEDLVRQRNRTDDTPIRVGPIEVAPVDGRVHVSLGAEGVTLDRHGVDDLVHALMEAVDATA